MQSTSAVRLAHRLDGSLKSLSLDEQVSCHGLKMILDTEVGKASHHLSIGELTSWSEIVFGNPT